MGAAAAFKAERAVDRGAAEGAGYADRRVDERLVVSNLRVPSEQADKSPFVTDVE